VGNRREKETSDRRENFDDAGKDDDSGVGHRTVGADSYARHSQEIYVPEA